MLSRFMRRRLVDVAELPAKYRRSAWIGKNLAHNNLRPTATFALPLVVFRPNSSFSRLMAFACLLGVFVSACGAQPRGPQGVKPPKAPEVAATPAVSLGTNADYQKAVLSVEQALEVGDFAKATIRMRLLPRHDPRIVWDDSKLPARFRPLVIEARDRAARDWAAGLGFSPVFVTDGSAADIKISFEQELGRPAASREPLSVAAFFSTDPKAPRLDYVIGLKRGAPLAASTETDIANDLSFGFGLYLGLAESPVPMGAMYRAEKPAGVVQASSLERVMAEHNFVLTDGLQHCIETKQKVASGVAIAFVDPTRLEPKGPVVQGTTVQFTIQVTNRGTAPMETRLLPVCSCFSTSAPRIVPAGETVLYPLEMNTVEYPATVNKTVFMLTSDPDRPTISIPVHVVMKPRYRFLMPAGDTILIGPDGGEFTVYLAVEGEPLTLEGQPTLAGVPGTVTYEPWTGTLPDPALGEPARLRKGYKLNLDVKPRVAPGQTFVSVNLTTSDSTFRMITARLLAQRGIVAVPDRAYFGHIAPERRELEVTVTRPGKPFHIIGLKVDDPKHVQVTQHVTPGRPWEHRLKIVFDGQVQSGDYAANVTIRTDDPDQPKITIPITATVE